MDIMLNTVLTIASVSAKNSESKDWCIVNGTSNFRQREGRGFFTPTLTLWYFSWYLPPHSPYFPPLPSPKIHILRIKSVHPDSRHPWWVHSQGCARSNLGRLKKELLLMKLGCTSLDRANSVTFAKHSNTASKHSTASAPAVPADARPMFPSIAFRAAWAGAPILLPGQQLTSALVPAWPYQESIQRTQKKTGQGEKKSGFSSVFYCPVIQYQLSSRRAWPGTSHRKKQKWQENCLVASWQNSFAVTSAHLWPRRNKV